MTMTTSASDSPATVTAPCPNPGAPTCSVTQLAPLLTIPVHSGPLGPLRLHDHESAAPAKWILHGQPAQNPPHVHACCAPKSLLPSSSSCASASCSHDHNADDLMDGPSFYDLMLRPAHAPPNCGYLVRNVFRYPGDNLVLTREYPDYVTRGPTTTQAGASVRFEFDCAVMHDQMGLEDHGDKVVRPLAELADKVGAHWVCCEGTLVVERVPLVARVASVVGVNRGAVREE
ncbi:hypothetical protein BCR44DRAFT_1422794 [Catenaria anguillulae PL171]|uniref:Uncharacterized protein n=1 Tax=Catenaria anguillulae PL171 TaxID=765915 RepID=A0A1Y2I3I9_9FUNG|nr:hypothetical protein BCR44DRAFT_1422794 [Catenaria anguillulae PL171]